VNVISVPSMPLPKTLWMMLAVNVEKSKRADAAGDLAPDDFWLICDVYAQRELCNGYFEYQKELKRLRELDHQRKTEYQQKLQQYHQQQQSQQRNYNNNNRGGRNSYQQQQQPPAPPQPVDLKPDYFCRITMFEFPYDVNMKDFKAWFFDTAKNKRSSICYPLAIVDA
jgi:hypothetical protein